MAREMKDSGVAWIGEIPTGWAVKKLKFVASFCQDKYQEGLRNLDYVGLENIISWSGKFVETESEYDKSQSLLFRRNDILWGKLRPYLAKVFHCRENGCCSGEFCIIRPFPSVDVRFLWNVLISTGFVSTVDQSTYGTKMPRANADFIKNMTIPVPPIAKQKSIGTFLDMKCKEIDAVLEKTRTSIEEYKKLKQAIITQAVTRGVRGDRPMKESGVAWIGVVPLEWTVSTLGKFITIDSGISVGKKYESGTPLVEVPYLRVANVQGDHVDLSDVATIMVTLEEAEKYKLKAGQLLMTEGGDRDKLGRGCLWNGEIENSIHQNHVFAVQTDNRLTVKYLDYLTTSEVARVYFDLTAKKTTNLACTSKSTIQKFVMPVPPVAEQNAICDYLDRECTKLDNILHSKSIIIEQLEAYKKSLIYEYVTGKKETSQPKSESTITFVDARALLLCRIIELLKPKGRIHLMKALFTVDCLLNLNSETQYQRQKHGPYDVQIEEYERIMEQKKWISIKKGRSVDYILAQDFETFRNLYEIHYGNVDQEIQRICAFLRPMKTSHAERVATLLAVWNDFIIDGITPTDSQIVQEVRSNWTPNKAHSSESTWLGTLSEMKAHQIMPFGYGKHTEHMQDSEV